MRSAAAFVFLIVSQAGTASEMTAANPRQILERYYAAIDRGDLRAAYAMWQGNGPASGRSYAAFARGFAETRATTVTIGEAGAEQGAAGTFYVGVPVQISAMERDGTTHRYHGIFTLRRVDRQIQGADPRMFGWHLYSARIRPVA